MANQYTFQVVDSNDLVSAAIEAEIARCAQFVIGLVSQYISWQGTLDFAVVIRPRAELTWSDADGLLPSIVQTSWNGSGWVNDTLFECLTGFDRNPGATDAGCTIYLAGDGTIKNHGMPVWFDPAPALGRNAAPPAGTADFIGILTHEVFHSLGFIAYTNEWKGRVTTSGDRSFFTGPATTDLYGAPVPFQIGSEHYGFTADPAVPITRGLMFQWGNYERNRFDIGRIDLAMLADLGHSIKTYDGLPLFELIDTALDLNGTAAADRLYGDYHANRILAGDGADLVEGGAGDDTIDGGEGNDRLLGGADDDRLDGGAGDDSIDGGAGSDELAGGIGDDVYIVDDGDTIVENANGGTDEVRTSLSAYSLLGTNLENLTGSADSTHDFRGSAGNNVIRGGSLRDMIRLQDGGDDSAIAGAGNDTIYFGGAFTALDTVDGGAGVDAIILQGDYRAGVTLGSGSVSNISGLESISLAPGHFADWGDSAGNSYSYNLTAIDANVPAGAILRINGHHLRAGENLTFNGSLEQDGRFFVFGGLGVDNLTGGNGNDIFVFGHDGRFGQTDVLHGGPGYDSIYLRGDYDLDFTQNGFGIFTGIESITLGWASDSQFVVGGDGEFDYRIVWKDSMIESGVRITVNGSGLAANETMIFDASDEAGGHFRLFGGASADTLTGGGGNDFIYGGLGWDILAGNGGSDTFLYYDTAESSITPGTFDQINGFTHLVDKIDLSSIDANANLAGDQAFVFRGNGLLTGAGQLRVVQLPPSFGTNNWQVEADTNGDGTPDLLIRVTVEAGQPLTASDFYL